MEDNPYGRFHLARVRAEVCHPELALRSLLCQFWSPYAYDTPLHLLCCSRCITLTVTVPTGIIVECLSEFWRQIGFKLPRARLEPHEDSFQNACVNHNRLDADDESATSTHVPHSKSLAGGIEDDHHILCNCIPSPAVVGYVAFYCQSAH